MTYKQICYGIILAAIPTIAFGPLAGISVGFLYLMTILIDEGN